jgi:hypothetical protein
MVDMRKAVIIAAMSVGSTAILLAAGNSMNPSVRADSPEWPDTKDYGKAWCPTNSGCSLCSEGTYVYACQKKRPASEYSQGACNTGYPGANTICWGTSFSCGLKVICPLGTATEDECYSGEWCRYVF